MVEHFLFDLLIFDMLAMINGSLFQSRTIYGKKPGYL